MDDKQLGYEILARITVLETLLCQHLIEAGKRSGEDGPDYLRAVFRPVEIQLLEAVRAPGEGKRQMAEAAHRYFNELSLALLGQVPHQGPN